MNNTMLLAPARSPPAGVALTLVQSCASASSSSSSSSCFSTSTLHQSATQEQKMFSSSSCTASSPAFSGGGLFRISPCRLKAAGTGMGGETGGLVAQAQCNGRWTRNYISKHDRHAIHKGFFHNTPNAKWNTLAWYQHEHRLLRKTIVNQTAKVKRCRMWYELLKGRVPGEVQSSTSVPRPRLGTRGRACWSAPEHELARGAPVNTASLINILSTSGPFTMFVPTNAALAKISGASWDRMHAEPKLLLRFLKRHVVQGKFELAEMVNSMNAVTTKAELSMGGPDGEDENEGEQQEVEDINDGDSRLPGAFGGGSGGGVLNNSHPSTTTTASNKTNYGQERPQQDELFCFSSEPVSYLHPESALMDSYLEHSYAKHYERANAGYILPDYEGAIPSASAGRQQASAQETALLAQNEDGTSSSSLVESEEDDVNPFALVAEESASDVQFALQQGRFRRHLPYGINESTFAGAELRTLEKPEERLPIFVKNSAEDQFFFGLPRRVAVGHSKCHILRSTR
ncbi:unnamed protein product, partial [Amoebophrya sp. A25]|eukprot:GSA25T00024166001.1